MFVLAAAAMALMCGLLAVNSDRDGVANRAG
jgi:hypothetical protein